MHTTGYYSYDIIDEAFNFTRNIRISFDKTLFLINGEVQIEILCRFSSDMSVFVFVFYPKEEV